MPSALLSNLQYNIDLNIDSEASVSVKHCDWFDYVSGGNSGKIESSSGISDEEFDLVIGSDLVNWEEDVRPLISTLKYFLRNGKSRALLFISIENRKALQTFLDLIKEEFEVAETTKIYLMQYDEMKPIMMVNLMKSC